MTRAEWWEIAQYAQEKDTEWVGSRPVDLKKASSFQRTETLKNLVFRLASEVDHQWSGDVNLRHKILQNIEQDPSKWIALGPERLLEFIKRLCAHDSSYVYNEAGINDWADRLFDMRGSG